MSCIHIVIKLILEFGFEKFKLRNISYNIICFICKLWYIWNLLTCLSYLKLKMVLGKFWIYILQSY